MRLTLSIYLLSVCTVCSLVERTTFILFTKVSRICFSVKNAFGIFIEIVFQSLSCVLLLVTPQTATHQAPLSFTIFWSLLKFMSMMLSNHLIPCCPFSFCLQSFLASGLFPVSWLFTSGTLITEASGSVSVLPMNIEGGSPLGLTGWISLLSKGLSKVFSSTTVWEHQFFGAQPSLSSSSPIHIWLLEKP